MDNGFNQVAKIPFFRSPFFIFNSPFSNPFPFPCARFARRASASVRGVSARRRAGRARLSRLHQLSFVDVLAARHAVASGRDDGVRQVEPRRLDGGLCQAYGGFGLPQPDVALCGQCLPVVFGQCLHLVCQQGGVRLDFRTFGQVERRYQPVVQYLGGVRHLGQLQLQRFPLQFVAGDVVLQDRSFAAACLHVGYHLLRQFQVLLQHLQLVVQLVEVQVVAREQEADFLPVFLPVQLGQLLLQFGVFCLIFGCKGRKIGS